MSDEILGRGRGRAVVLCVCGSFCTHARLLETARGLAEEGWELWPLVSEVVWDTDTRFGSAEKFRASLEEICGHPVMHTIAEAEPIGPKSWADAVLIAPCTGNTLGKLACGITDSSVTMAAKAQLRNKKPVVLAVSTNDGLSASAKNIGALRNTRNIYFVPMGQDDPENKETSLIADFTQCGAALEAALEGHQLQPAEIQRSR